MPAMHEEKSYHEHDFKPNLHLIKLAASGSEPWWLLRNIENEMSLFWLEWRQSNVIFLPLAHPYTHEDNSLRRSRQDIHMHVLMVVASHENDVG